jgi:hypothetical protein
MTLGGDGAALKADQVRPADWVAAFLVRQIRDGFIPHGMLAVHRGLLPDVFPRIAIIPRQAAVHGAGSRRDCARALDRRVSTVTNRIRIAGEGAAMADTRVGR